MTGTTTDGTTQPHQSQSHRPRNRHHRPHFPRDLPSAQRTFPGDEGFGKVEVEITGKISQTGSQIHLFGTMMVNQSGPFGRETAISHDPAGIWDRISLGGAV
jgi:hypothetical protein